MKVEAGKAVLLIRYNNYKKTNFIEEHNKIACSKGYVWMLKAGRKLVESKLSKIKNESSLLILKAPKGDGGEYYYSEIMEFRYGDQIQKDESPEYYGKLVGDEKLWQIESLDGTWLKLHAIKPLDEDIVEKFKLLSNKKKLIDVIGSTMSSAMYVYSDEDITL